MKKAVDYDQILTDVSAFIPDGIVDFTKPLHMQVLKEALMELGYPEEFINEYTNGIYQSAVKINEKKPAPKPKRTATQHRPKANSQGETGASKEARQKELDHIAFGYYGKNGKVMYKSSDDKQKLVALSDKEKVSAQQKADSKSGKGVEKQASPGKGTPPPQQKKVSTDPTKSPAFNAPVAQDSVFYAKSKKLMPLGKMFTGLSASVKKAFLPKKYLNIIERMMSVEPKGDAAGIGFFTEGGAGAGTTESKGGELAAMAFITMSDKEFDTAYPKMLAYAQALEKTGKKGALDSSWLEAARNARNATLQRFRKLYPGGQIVGAAWDVPEEVEALGLPYKNKEASTDVFFKIRLADGTEIVDQTSLKKDFGSAIMNPGVGKVLTADIGISKDVLPEVFYEKRRQSYIQAAKTFFPNSDYLERLGDLKNKEVWKEMYEKIKDSAGKGDKKAEAWIQKMEKDFHDWNVKTVNEFKKNKKLVERVLTGMSERLPIKGILAGKESITIGNVSLDKLTAKEIFGTSDFNLIKTRLTMVTPKDGNPYLLYRAGKNAPEIPLATMRLKDESGRYSTNAKFIMEWHPEFKKRIVNSHKTVYGSIVEGAEGGEVV